MGPVYQCCYTNAARTAGGRVRSGWQVSAASPDIPGPARETCARLQNANASLCAGAVDEDGNSLTLRQLAADGGCLYVIRSRFGLSDRLGRPNMFSHALIFPLKNGQNILENPNFYLSLHPSAFLQEERDFTWTGTPPYSRSITLGEAMELAGLDRERYAVLVRCVCARMSDPRAQGPLYLQYGGDARERLGLLYCICAGIPQGMLRHIRAASCPTANDGGQTLVFTRSARSRPAYLIPRTGENNLLTRRVQRRLDRWGYVDYPVRELPEEQFPVFFSRLDAIAAALGDPADPLVLKLAFQFGLRRDNAAFSDGELISSLSDALRLGRCSRRTLDIVLTRILREMGRRELTLTPELCAALDAYLAGSQSEELKAAGQRLRFTGGGR